MKTRNRKKYMGEPNGLRKCTKCGEEKSPDDFGLQNKERNVFRRYCRSCWNKYCSASRRQKSYGVTQEQVDSLLASQGGGCAICGSKTPRGTKSFCLDHNHKTGKVRGLLCNGCNRGMGLFGDSQERMRLAIQYLIRTDDA